MNLNFFENIEKSMKNTNKKKEELQVANSIEVELAQKLGTIEEYAIDRFEGNYAVLENRKTGKMKDILINELPEGSKEGDILKFINGKYYLEKEQTLNVEKEIQEKYNNLWE